MTSVDRMRRWERWASGRALIRQRSLAAFAVSRLAAELHRGKSSWAASILVQAAAGSLEPAASKAFQTLAEGCEDPRVAGTVIYQCLLQSGGGDDDSDATWSRVAEPLLLGDSPPRLIQFLDRTPTEETSRIVEQLMMCVSFSSPERPQLRRFLSSTDQPLILEALQACWYDSIFLPTRLVTEVCRANPHVQPSGTDGNGVLLAVIKDRLDLLDFTRPHTVDALLHGAERADLADKCLRVLKALPPGPAQERLCEIVPHRAGREDVATKVAVEAGYVPGKLEDRIVFFFLTEQWSRYDAIDPTGELLYAAYAGIQRAAGDHGLTSKLIETARRNGRPDPAVRYYKENYPDEIDGSDGKRRPAGGYSSDYGIGGDHGGSGWTGGSFHA
ncbi:hypothetical protein ACFCV3_02200 [Kribbella sp. NPDC056345]|uniref:hypothetical protein n=1 Tax=Kribbella sp. NPDC056345 TaxID=3345789 RepID=UPI0035DA16D3